jgi:hypothetical protein
MVLRSLNQQTWNDAKSTKTWLKKGGFDFAISIRCSSTCFCLIFVDIYWYLLHWYLLIFVDIYWYLLIFIDSLLYSLIFKAIYHDIDFHFKNPIISVSRNRSTHQAAQAQTCLGGEIEVQPVTKPSKLAIQQKQIGICLGYKCWDVLLALFDIYIYTHTRYHKYGSGYNVDIHTRMLFVWQTCWLIGHQMWGCLKMQMVI